MFEEMNLPLGPVAPHRSTGIFGTLEERFHEGSNDLRTAFDPVPFTVETFPNLLNFIHRRSSGEDTVSSNCARYTAFANDSRWVALSPEFA
jgi:hypothetical protein